MDLVRDERSYGIPVASQYTRLNIFTIIKGTYRTLRIKTDNRVSASM